MDVNAMSVMTVTAMVSVLFSAVAALSATTRHRWSSARHPGWIALAGGLVVLTSIGVWAQALWIMGLSVSTLVALCTVFLVSTRDRTTLAARPLQREGATAR